MRSKLSPAQALLVAGHPGEALTYLPPESDDIQTMYLRALCYRHLEKFDDAAGLINRILEREPNNFAALNTCGMIATDVGAFLGAADTFQQSLNAAMLAHAEPDKLAQIRLNYAYALMRLGKFEIAWPLWESSRFGYSWHANIVPWSGQPGRVLVICEGGYGDQILFSRWLHRLSTSTSGIQFTYYCFSELVDILPISHIPIIRHPRGQKISHGQIDVDWNKFDYATSIMSLPAIARLKTVEEIPADPSIWTYRRVPDDFQDGIGLCWEAEEIGVQRNLRSMDVRLFKELAQRLNREFVSLCPGREHPSWVSDVALNSWVDTCSVLTRLKFVITIDTAVAHLAGALDVPTYLMLPAGSDWKWFTRGLVGDVSPWYPSMHVIRNTADPNSWAPAIDLLTYKLRQDGRILS